MKLRQKSVAEGTTGDGSNGNVTNNNNHADRAAAAAAAASMEHEGAERVDTVHTQVVRKPADDDVYDDNGLNVLRHNKTDVLILGLVVASPLHTVNVYVYYVGPQQNENSRHICQLIYMKTNETTSFIIYDL